MSTQRYGYFIGRDKSEVMTHIRAYLDAAPTPAERQRRKVEVFGLVYGVRSEPTKITHTVIVEEASDMPPEKWEAITKWLDDMKRKRTDWLNSTTLKGLGE
jgi:hypothetical protein